MEASKDEAVTPAGRLFLQPQFNQIINCAMGFEQPFNLESLKSELSNSLMIKHPRFSSLLVVDNHGREFWRRTQINLDDHLIIHQINPSSSSDSDSEIDEKVNSFLADFAVSSPLSTDKPLWEIHLMIGLKCAILRLHHSLGDGVSLISLILASCKRLHDKDDDDDNGEKKMENTGKKKSGENGLVGILKMIWWTITAVVGFIGRILWVKDVDTAISGGDGVELWPRLAATAKFSLQDMKTVKTSIPNATINDVLFGVISYGFSKYLDFRSSHGLHEGLELTGLAMVNLRKQVGVQVASMRNYRITCNTTFTISNIVGPQQELAFAGNPITYIRATSTSLPHALTMHMVSYLGMADMQILAAKEIIPDPQFLAKCFEDALFEMKTAATTLVS